MYYAGLTVRGNILGIKSGQSDHQVSASLDRSWSSYKHTQIGDCYYIVIHWIISNAMEWLKSKQYLINQWFCIIPDICHRYHQCTMRKL